jgi:hypothetical protein
MVCLSNAGQISGNDRLICPMRGATVSVAMMVRNDSERMAARFNFMTDDAP